jgi:hypothetical protein
MIKTVLTLNHFCLSKFVLKFIHFKNPVTYAILISFISVVIFAYFVLISAKMTTLLKEMRIA